MHLRCGGIFNDRFIANFQEIVTVKEFRKSANIWWSYFDMFRGGGIFFRTQCMCVQQILHLFSHYANFVCVPMKIFFFDFWIIVSFPVAWMESGKFVHLTRWAVMHVQTSANVRLTVYMRFDCSSEVAVYRCSMMLSVNIGNMSWS